MNNSSNNSNIPNNQQLNNKTNSGIEKAQNNAQMRNDANVQNRNANIQGRTPNTSLRSSKSSNNATVPNQSQNTKANQNNIRNNSSINNSNQNSSMTNQAASIGLQAFGIPKPASDLIVNRKKGQKMISRLKRRSLLLSGIDKFNKVAEEKVSETGDTENIDNPQEQDNPSKEVVSGTVDLVIKIKKYKWFLIIGISVFSIIFFLCIITAIFADGTAASGAFSSDATSEYKDEEWDKNAQDRLENENGDKEAEENIIDNNDTGYIEDQINSHIRFVKNKIGLTSDDIADYYGVEIACDGNKSKKCTTGDEYRFYLKMYDIYYLYKNKYGVKLDLPLIMASLVYSNAQMPVVLKSNLNDYNREEIKSDDYAGDLSWEFDYKNYSGYTYLNANDNRFDMQILAKNMVTKKTAYRCINGSNNVSRTQSTTENGEKGDGWDSVTKVKYDNGIERTYRNYKQYNNGNSYYNKSYWNGNIETDGCGPSSVAIVLSGYGYNYNPGNIVDKLHKLKIYQTNSFNLVKLLNSLKIKTERKDIINKQEAINDIRKNFKAGRPIMIGTTNHWVVYVGENENGLIISDPGNGDGNNARYGKTLEDLVQTPGVETYILIKSDGLSSNDTTTENTESDFDTSDPNLKIVKNIESSKYDEQLTCDDGTLDVSSIEEKYVLDKKKFNEFLLEFIEHKYFMEGTKVDSKNNNIKSSISNSLADAFVKVAERELDRFNKGETNAAYYQSYTNRYDAWCASFVSYVVGNTEYKGKKLSEIIPVKSASVNDFADYFSSQNKFYRNSNCSYYKKYHKYTPKPGDIVIFNNAGENHPGLEHPYLDHIGIVEKVENNTVYTIEGNTGVGVVDQNSFGISDCKMLAFGSWY